jgi:hypothetical protein
MPAGATYEPIATASVSGTTTTTFSSISSSFTDLIVVCQAKYDSGVGTLQMRLNGDTSTIYSRTLLIGDGSTATSSRSGTLQSFNLTGGAALSTTEFQFVKVHLMSYAGSTNKTALAEHSGDLNGSGRVGRYVFLWASTAAINSITLFTNGGNFSTGTTFTLYGIKAA